MGGERTVVFANTVRKRLQHDLTWQAWTLRALAARLEALMDKERVYENEDLESLAAEPHGTGLALGRRP